MALELKSCKGTGIEEGRKEGVNVKATSANFKVDFCTCHSPASLQRTGVLMELQRTEVLMELQKKLNTGEKNFIKKD
ncbi:hypothetical protein BgiMline_007826, partial [Biomphalaria glabrata]